MITVINHENTWETLRLLLLQLFLTGIFVVVMGYSVYFIDMLATKGDPGLAFMTLLLSFAFDQVKSIGFLYMIYVIVVRRFMHLSVNEADFIKTEITSIPKRENSLPRLQVFCLKTLESTIFEMMSLALISVYTVFVLFQLTLASIFPVPKSLLSQMDTVFLTLFFSEISAKTFASNLMFLVDPFNLFDTSIVLISYVLNLIGIEANSLAVLRLLRVVVIVIRKITGNQSKLRHQSKMSNPVESVIKILKAIVDAKELNSSVKKEARWAVEIIESNKLYELNFDMATEEKSMGVEAKAWLNITTEAANDTTQWFERDLDDFLKEIHREDEEPDPNKLEEEEERIKQIINVQPRVWNIIIKIMDDFDKWDFDIFKYHE